jgi:hypothetical protein
MFPGELNTKGIGTLQFMAPESLASTDSNSQDVDGDSGPPVDVFAWACTVFNFVTDKHVLDGNRMHDVIHAARTGIRPQIPSN